MSILISFIAKNNDRVIKDDSGNIKSCGPTISFVKNYNSKFKNKIDKSYILYMGTKNSNESKEESQLDIVNRVIHEAKEIIPEVTFKSKDWGDGVYISPIDHNGIFKALAGNIPGKNSGILRSIIDENRNSDYIIHLSPGTPAMHSIWLLITRYIQFNWKVSLYQSFRDNLIPVDMDASFYDQINTTAKSLSEINFFPKECLSLQNVNKQIDIYKKLNLPILILGERGSGKTTLSKELRSLRYPEKKDFSWPIVACGQFDDNTMRSELFGHVVGAFTGAIKNRNGLLKELDNDLLFLDEVGDLSKETQRLLIRALDEKKFSPLGSGDTVSSDFTLITATNKSISELRESIDADFFDRISTVIITMPSIRNNREDIIHLFDQLFEKVKNSFTSVPGDKSLNLNNKEIILDALSDKTKFKLEGNMRDLEFVCKHYIAHKLSYNNELDAVNYSLIKLEEREKLLCGSDASLNIRLDINKESRKLYVQLEEDLSSDFSLDLYFEKVKSDLIHMAYDQCNKNASKTANFLGYKNHGSITRCVNKK